MRSSVFRPSRRICAPEASAASSSTVSSTGLGRSTFAACWRPTLISSSKNPIATKRVLRAILKAADFCAAQPERVARRLVDGGFTARYEFALETLSEIPYAIWRDYDAEDTIRFYSLRLHEAGMIKSAPTRSSRKEPIGVSSTSSSAS